MTTYFTNIQNLDINKIYPHPDNPGKDLGDLTELADSIYFRYDFICQFKHPL